MGKRVGEGRTMSITIITYTPQLMDSCCQSPECTKRPQPAPWDPTCISCLCIQEVCFCWDLGLQSLPEQVCLSLVLPLVPSPGGTSAPCCRCLLSHLSSPCLQPRLLVLLTAFPASGSLHAWDCSFCILYIYISIFPCWRGRRSLFCYSSEPTHRPEHPLSSFVKAAPFPRAIKISPFYT